MSFDAGQISATLDLDRSPFIRSLNEARKSASDFARQVYEATVGTDGVTQAQAEVKDLEGSLTKLGATRTDVTANLVDKVSSHVREIQALLARFSTEHPTVTADFDGGPVARGVAEATSEVTGLGRLNPTVTADFDKGGVTRGVAEVTAEAVALGRLNPTVTADFDGGKAIAGMTAFTGAATGATGATSALRGSMLSLTSPLVLGALGVALVGAAAAAGPLAAGLTVVGAAATSAAAGVGAIVAAIVPSILQFKRYAEAQKEAEQATEKVKSAQDAYKNSQQSLADAQRQVADSERNLADTRRQAAENVAQAESDYRDQLRAVSDAARQVKASERAVHEAQAQKAEDVAAAESAYRDALRNVAEQQRQVKVSEQGVHEAQAQKAQQVAQAESAYRDSLRNVADQQRQLQSSERALADARRASAQQVAQAESSLQDARQTLLTSTRSLSSAQRDLNLAERDEPLNQREATLNLADARDAASDAARAYAEAVDEYGRNSEEATDALRQQKRAQLDLQRTEIETRDIRRNGSEELRSARDGVKQAYDSQRDAVEGVKSAEQDLEQSRRDGVRSVADQQQQVAENQRALADSQREAASAQDAIGQAARDGNSAIADSKRQLADSQRALADSQREAASAQDAIGKAARDGNSAIADSRQQLADSQRDLASQQREAAAAQKNITAVQAEGARQIAEAQRQVEDSQRQARRSADDLADAARDLKSAQKEAAGGAGILSAANMRLMRTWKGVLSAFKGNRDIEAANDTMANLGTRIGQLAKGAIPALAREAREAARVVRNSFARMGKELGENEKNSISRILDSASQTIGRLFRSSVRFGAGIANVFAQATPFVRKFTGWIEDMSRRFLRFTRSTEGKSSIREFFRSAIPMAKALAKFTGEVVSDVVDFGKKHGKDVARTINLIADSLNSWFGEGANSRRNRKAAQSGTQQASIYAAHFGRTAKKQGEERMPTIGQRWGKLIGDGVGGALRAAADHAIARSGKKGGDKFFEAFAGAVKHQFKGLNWMDFLKSAFALPHIRKASFLDKFLDVLGGRFNKAGKHAAQGYVSAFVSNLPAGKLLEAVARAREALRKYQKEHSPSKLWAEQGKNAGLGYIKGWDGALKGLNLPELPRSVRTSVEHRIGQTREGRRAMSPSSPGGRAITAQEMRAIMREHGAKDIDYDRLGRAFVQGFEAGMENSVAPYLQHRNRAGADPR